MNFIRLNIKDVSIMGTTKNFLAGLGGAIALNIIHESLKGKDEDMPRIDLLGEQALGKVLAYTGHGTPPETELYAPTLAADVLSNATYYSMIGTGRRRHLWARATLLGIAAGIGAVTLPKSLGLNPEPVTKSQKVKLLTVGYYLAGALVTGAILAATTKNNGIN